MKCNYTADWSRRTFLRTVTAAPTLRLLAQGGTILESAGEESSSSAPSGKFTPIDLDPHFNCSPADFGPREKARELGGDSAQDGLIRMPAGKQSLRGIPFRLGGEGVEKKSWVVLSAREHSWSKPRVRIPIGRIAHFICLASFCDWDESEEPRPFEDAMERVGQRLADAVMIYGDGGERILPVRRRFEVNSPTEYWGRLGFASLPHRSDAPRKLTDPLRSGSDWGTLQPVVISNVFGGEPMAVLWVCTLANPDPERPLEALVLKASGEDPWVVCGLTLFHGRENPLRWERLTLYRLTLPQPTAAEEGRWKVEVDLGVVARTYVVNDFQPQSWLSAPTKGLGENRGGGQSTRQLYVEVTASSEGTLTLLDTQTGKKYLFDLGRIVPGQEIEANPSGPRVEVLEHEKVWVHGQVVDSATSQPTPVRLAFRSKEGRYIPPYGHRTDVNAAWFEDYGADLKLGESSFAYVDGTFQVELPVGEVYAELSKGFEYDPMRKRLAIAPGQRELKLEISRFMDLRSRGWITADTHVHFLSPSTAVLEGQAEGLNLINLLAAQWGDLFTNVGDLYAGPLTSRDGETLVEVSTENRQHILGHLGALGVKGTPVFPLSAGGPAESYLGGPVWNSLAEWADVCRQRGGLAVAVHFPYPAAETTADIVLNKIDAVELYPFTQYFNTRRYLDWYRYLNCGYRLPIVGGTDKMGAYMPVGANRTYAYLGQEEFSFANWARAVRRGNTFETTGPLLLFRAEGHVPGDEITLGSGGGTVEFEAEAKCFVPFHRLEVVLNGRVVASREHRVGVREMTLKEKVKVDGPGWLAARCASSVPPTTIGKLFIAAHTSPLYIRVPGQELFSASAAAYMLTLIEGCQIWLENLATRPDAERFNRLRQMLTEARERLHHRMHEHKHFALSRP